MRTLPSTLVLTGLPGVAAAHVTDAPLLLHALEHGWLLVAVVVPLALLLPMRSPRR